MILSQYLYSKYVYNTSNALITYINIYISKTVKSSLEPLLSLLPLLFLYFFSSQLIKNTLGFDFKRKGFKQYCSKKWHIWSWINKLTEKENVDLQNNGKLSKPQEKTLFISFKNVLWTFCEIWEL